MKRFVVAQLGARRHYAIPRMLDNAGMLERFYTDICAAKGWPRLLGAAPERLRPPELRRLLSRVPHGVSPDRISTFDMFAVDYARRLRRARTAGEQSDTFLWAAKRFNRRVLERGFGQASGVYTFNGAGLEILRGAVERGLETVMEQTSAPPSFEARLIREGYEHHPDWMDHPPPGEGGDMEERIRAEWENASLILCGSEFVRDSIEASGGPVERCIVVPYGIESRNTPSARTREPGPLRVLTVGRVSLPKGAPYVAEAAERLTGRAVFRMVGTVSVPPAAQRRLSAALEITGPVPRSEVARHFAWADVFLLPSLCEGSAGVTYEALSAGLPVICTHNTGSVVRHGSDGYIVGLRDVDAIAGHLDRLASDADLLAGMSAAAAARRGDIDLDAYRQRLLAALSGAPGTERLTA